MKYYLLFFLALFQFKVVVENPSFRCDYKFMNDINGWMKFHYIPAVWADARQRCAIEGCILASPSSCIMRQAMLKIIKNKHLPRKQLFTGLHATVSKGEFYSVEGISMMEFDYAWAEDQPDNMKNDEDCLTLNGDLTDVRCDDTFPYICYKSNDPDTKVNRCGTTDQGYQYYAEKKSCYKFQMTPRNFSRAKFACDAEGAHLAIIKSEGEAKLLKDLFAKYPKSSFFEDAWKSVSFVGYYDWNERGIWRTIYGQTLEEAGYSTFSPGEPNNASVGQFCLALMRNGKFDDFFCHEPISFICEKKPDFPKVCTNSLKLRKDFRYKNKMLIKNRKIFGRY